ncbi:MAG: hypothetical protein WDM77_13485 [Steroidobacteraceae bacterium]
MADANAQARSAWWVRLLAALPWWVMNPLADAMAWLSWRVVRVEQRPLRANLTASFPDLTEAQLQRLMRDYYRGFAQVLVEVVRSVSLTPEELRRRGDTGGLRAGTRGARVRDPGCCWWPRNQCNWEWMLLALSLELGYPLEGRLQALGGWLGAARDAQGPEAGSARGWCPPRNCWRTSCAAGRTPRAIAMVADQEPRTSERRHWTRFMNRDTAFFLGAEEITRVTKFPAFFVGTAADPPRALHRVGNRVGAGRGEVAPWGADRTLCAPGGSADPRIPGRLALVTQALEAQEVTVRRFKAAPNRRSAGN